MQKIGSGKCHHLKDFGWCTSFQEFYCLVKYIYIQRVNGFLYGIVADCCIRNSDSENVGIVLKKSVICKSRKEQWSLSFTEMHTYTHAFAQCFTKIIDLIITMHPYLHRSYNINYSYTK